MAIVDGSGQSDGLTAVTGAGGVFGVFGGSAPGLGGGSANGNGNFAGAGTAAGVASGSAFANLDGVFAGQASGVALVQGETHPWGAGSAAGYGLLSPADGAYLAGGSGVAAGVGTPTASAGILHLSSGQVIGQGQLLWDYLVDGDGQAIGLGTLTGTGLRVINAFGLVQGSSALVWSYPLPMVGKTVISAHAEVVCVPILRLICAPAKTFRYLQLLQRGDLSIFISDHQGPVSPVRVTFTVFQIRPDGSRRQVGPADRSPVRGVVGEFYATGHAGEMGQPGSWAIQWTIQQSFQSACQSKEQCFQVQDAVMAADPRDVTVRARKFGWN